VQTPVYGTGSEYEMHLKPRGPFRICPDTLTFACVNLMAHGLAEAHDMPTAATVYLSPEMRPLGAGMLQCAPVTTMWHRAEAARAVAAWEPVAAIDVIVARRIDIDAPTAAARRSLVEPPREILNIWVPLWSVRLMVDLAGGVGLSGAAWSIARCPTGVTACW
jgi:hypothetical protein